MSRRLAIIAAIYLDALLSAAAVFDFAEGKEEIKLTLRRLEAKVDALTEARGETMTPAPRGASEWR